MRLQAGLGQDGSLWELFAFVPLFVPGSQSDGVFS